MNLHTITKPFVFYNKLRKFMYDNGSFIKRFLSLNLNKIKYICDNINIFYLFEKPIDVLQMSAKACTSEFQSG